MQHVEIEMFKTIRPRKIRLDASTLCQLHCPCCSTTAHKIEPAIGFGFLKFKDFKKLLDENRYLKEIELSNYGEIFLNPELDSIIKYAYEKKVRLLAENGVNFNTVTDQMLEMLVAYRFRLLLISIDGASHQTYQQYRVNGNFDRVIKNIGKLNNYKSLHDSSYPRLIWQFVIFGHNEHEIPLAKKMAQDFGMRFILKLSWDRHFSPIKNPDFVKKESGLPVSDCEADQVMQGAEYGASFCRMLWEEPQINWDGKILGCCCNHWRQFDGNAFTDGLVPALNSESITYARAMLQGLKPLREDIPCATCDLYLERAKANQWLKRGVNMTAFRVKSRLRKLIHYALDQ